MKTLYPEIEPYQTHLFETDDGHQVYVEECGNPDGLPVLFLHGGPGSGCKPHHRSFFDPARYRIILMDQRGCGRSRPLGLIEHNDTHALLRDILHIRRAFEIGQWLLFGGSWGATLALLAAEAEPETVRGLILRGTFLARQADLDWFLKDGANRLYPEAWADFTKGLGAGESILKSYHDRLRVDDARGREAARSWDQWGGAVVLGEAFDPELLSGEVPDGAFFQARIETHYATHRYFIEENEILNRSDRIQHVPCILVHGRQDFMCPVESAWALKQRLPNASLRILPDATHLAQGETMVDALVSATDDMADRLLR